MTKTQNYIEQIRTKMGGVSNYALAKELDLHGQKIARLCDGTQEADAYTAAQIGVILGIDPLKIMAEIGEESARSERGRDFWKSFRSGLKLMVLGFGLFGIWGTSGTGQNANAGTLANSHNGRLRQRPKNRKAPEGDFFMGAEIRSRTRATA